MIVDLLATAALAVLPFVVGTGIGIVFHPFRTPLLVVTGIPAVYFTINLLVALERQGLRETLVIGIPLGISPVFIMLLTVTTGGLFLGIGASNRLREPLETWYRSDR